MVKHLKILSKLLIFFSIILISGCGSSSSQTNEVPPPATEQYKLSIAFSGTGKGRVFIKELNQYCDTSCNLTDLSLSKLTLVGEPLNSEQLFTGWSSCNLAVECEIDLQQTNEVTASFSQKEYVNLSLSIVGTGSINVASREESCESSCNFTYLKDSTVSLSINSTIPSTFISWGEQCNDSANICQFTITSDTAVTANFTDVLASDAENYITISEPFGEDQVNYPIQIARPFNKGEIENYPQALLNGQPLLTQADIKQRYDDGSVKHAIISFVLATLPANSQQRIYFANQKESSNTPLTVEQMLSTDYDFDAKINFSFPSSISVSAREMIQKGNFEYWQQGSITTSIILRDNTAARNFDLGNDDHRSIHPYFIITFWPQLNDYEIRYIAEISNSEALQDQQYDVSLTSGLKAEKTHYQQTDVFHHAKTRWSRKFWHATNRMPVSINHNVAYLRTTRFIPNFDISKTIPESDIEQYYSHWQTLDTKLFGEGQWQKYMPATGGRDDLGIYTTWAMKWLYTGHWKMQEMAYTQAELAGSWPFFIREGKADRHFDFNNSVSAYGKPLSIAPNARPTLWIAFLDWYEVEEKDRIIAINEIESTAWVADNAHHPDIASLQYLLSGDYFFLEQSYFSAAYGTLNNAGFATKAVFGRGPTGSVGGLFKGQTRGQGWTLRTRAHTLSITPDSHPEKAYYSRLIQDALTSWEGIFDIRAEDHTESDTWQHGRTIIADLKFATLSGLSPLNTWSSGTNDARYINDTILNTTQVSRAQAPWEQNIMITALGRAEELGFCSTDLKQWAGKTLIEMLNSGTIDPALYSVFVQPLVNKDGEWFTSWDEAASTFTEKTTNNAINDVANPHIEANMSTQAIGMGALSYLSDMENHDQAWGYIEENILIKSAFLNNPKWAILPREIEVNSTCIN